MLKPLAEKIPLVYERPDEFTEWLERMSKAKVLSFDCKKEGSKVTWILSGKINTMISNTVDPITNLVMLGFAFYGELWPMMPDAKQAFKFIKKWWKQRRDKNEHI